MTPLPRDDRWARAEGSDDATVEAAGKVSEALEWVERARGHLYEFHQLMGHADGVFGEAVDALRAAGHGQLADRLETDVVGRNVLAGRWTFQIVEEFDDDYYEPVKASERAVRDGLMGGRRHVYEAELKEQRRTQGRRYHESRPDDARGPRPSSGARPGPSPSSRRGPGPGAGPGPASQ